MINRYQAIIKGNTIRWIDVPDNAIDSNKEIPVYVTIQVESLDNMNGTRMAEALDELSKIPNGISSIGDPSSWQKDLRKDRNLNL